MVSLAAHARSRRVLAGLVLGAALLRGLMAPAPPERTVDALVRQLAEVAGAVVLPGDLAWEPSRGPLLDLLLGRGLVFLAARGDAGERDVLRARISVTPEGHPLGVRALAAVTRTPLADESGLEVRGRAAVFAATAAGTVRAVTVLGVEPRLRDALSTRALAAPRRVDLVPIRPPPRTELTFADGKVRVTFPGAERPVEVELDALAPGPETSGSGVEVLERPTSAGDLALALLDELRERYPA
ncbi:MAG: hypothetical protein FJ104_13385, partial [Deltaproteobacteria bacterium]|nr:hypothetical protein [Deltaproteobacteria bacterium]